MYLISGSKLQLDEVLLKIQQFQVSHKPAGISTAAEWAVSLRERGLLVANTSSLNSFLEKRAVNWWPTSTVEPFPAVGSIDTAVCQPFVSSRIAEILNSGGQVHEKRSKQSHGRSKYCENTMRVVFESQPCDGHAIVSFSNRRPDIVCYYGDRRGGSSITIIGDVKRCEGRNKDFPAEEVGHILDMAEDLLKKEQFNRPVLFCFLTDGFRFQYFRCSRSHRCEDISFEQSPVYGGEHGWQV